jgi:NAD(P)H-dependent FMN reductase
MKRIVFSCILCISTLSAEVKVLAFSGSTREDSYNRKLLREAAVIAQEMGATVTIIDLKDFPMPFYDADLEKQQGMPPNVKRLRDLMIASDAVTIG